MVVTVADTQKEPAKILLPDRAHHCMGVMSARTRKPKPVMRMPFPYVLKSIAAAEGIAHLEEVIHILIEEGALVIRSRAGADCIHHNRNAVNCPVAEELPSCLDVGVIKYASRDVIHLAAEDLRSGLWIRIQLGPAEGRSLLLSACRCMKVLGEVVDTMPLHHDDSHVDFSVLSAHFLFCFR